MWKIKRSLKTIAITKMAVATGLKTVLSTPHQIANFVNQYNEDLAQGWATLLALRITLEQGWATIFVCEPH